MFIELNDKKKRIINTGRICGLSKSYRIINVCYEENCIEANYNDDEMCIEDYHKLKELLEVKRL